MADLRGILFSASSTEAEYGTISMSPLQPTVEAFCFLPVPKKQNMELFQWPFTADCRGILFSASSKEAEYGTISMSPLQQTIEAFSFLSVPKKQNMELFQCPLYGRP